MTKFEGLEDDPAFWKPAQVRMACRENLFDRPTRGAALGWVHCNLVVLDATHAYEFLLFCQRNHRACPVLEVCDRGSPEPGRLAPGCDLRTDLARYSVFANGHRLGERDDISDLWTPNSVAFLIGSGITFDGALRSAGVQTDHHRWIVNTAIDTRPAGPFHGKLVATMRWLTAAEAIKATQVSSRFPQNHGAPIHIGDPRDIGAELDTPLFGGSVGEIPKGMIPVFWACGVTPQNAALAAKLDLVITHAPAHGLPVDIRADELATG